MKIHKNYSVSSNLSSLEFLNLLELWKYRAVIKLDNREISRYNEAEDIQVNKRQGGIKMDYPYTIDDLSSKCKVSKQSIYNLLGKPSIFGDDPEFVKNHSSKKSRKVMYSQEILNRLLDYYGEEVQISQGANNVNQGNQDESSDNHQLENKPSQAESSQNQAKEAEIEELKKERTALQEEVNRLKSEKEELKKQLEKTEGERVELMKQNGVLALTLQQSQQEKLLLLPAPKKGFFERRREKKELKARIEQLKQQEGEGKP